MPHNLLHAPLNPTGEPRLHIALEIVLDPAKQFFDNHSEVGEIINDPLRKSKTECYQPSDRFDKLCTHHSAWDTTYVYVYCLYRHISSTPYIYNVYALNESLYYEPHIYQIRRTCSRSCKCKPLNV